MAKRIKSQTNQKTKAPKTDLKHAIRMPAFWTAGALLVVILILAVSFFIAQKNAVEIIQLQLNGVIEVAVGEETDVGFNVGTAKTEDNDRVVAAVNKLHLVWTVDDESIATYDEGSGTVTGVKTGTTQLTVATDDGKLSDTCEVVVTPEKVSTTTE